MSVTIKEVKLVVSGESAGAEQSLDRTRQKLVELERVSKSSSASFGEQIRAHFQAERASGETAVDKLFGGKGDKFYEYAFGFDGAKFAASTFIMGQVGAAAESLATHLQKVKEGAESAGDAIMNIAKGIPVLGGAVAAGAALGKMLRAAAGMDDPEEGLKQAEARAATVNKRIEAQNANDNRRALLRTEGDEKAKEEIRQKYAKINSDAAAAARQKVKEDEDHAEQEVRSRAPKPGFLAGVGEIVRIAAQTEEDVQTARAAVRDAAARKARESATAGSDEQSKNAKDEALERGRVELSRMRAMDEAQRQEDARKSKSRAADLKANDNPFGAAREEANQAYHEAGYAAAEAYAKGIREHPADAEALTKIYMSALVDNDSKLGSRLKEIQNDMGKQFGKEAVGVDSDMHEWAQGRADAAAEQKTVEREILDMQLEGYREAASSGDAEAARLAKQLDIRRQEQAIMERVAKIQNNPEVDDAHKAAARGAGRDRLEQLERDLNRGGRPAIGGGEFIPAGGEAGYRSVFGQASSQADTPQRVKIDDMDRLAKEIGDAVGTAISTAFDSIRTVNTPSAPE